MLQACLNGGRGFPAPATPKACAEAAHAACAAGAQSLHIHPRDANGSESLAPDDVADWLQAVREAVPGIPVGIGTGAWIAPGGRARHADMQAWEVLPDYVSINLGEEDAPDVMALMQSKGIGIEAGIWSVADAERFLELDVSVLRNLVEIPDIEIEAATAEARAICALLEGKGPVLLHGEDRSAWPMLRLAGLWQMDTRIGFEDVLVMPDGKPAPDNASLVTAALAENEGLTS